MASNADAATGAVQMVTEVQAKILKITADITGDLSKDVLKLLFLVISNNNKSNAQKELLRLMNSDEGVKTITIKNEGLWQFDELAKAEKLDYRSVGNIENGTVMISFKLSDIDKVNRILEKMPATVKLDRESIMKSLMIEEQDRTEAQKEAMGMNEPGGLNALSEDITVGEGRSAEVPEALAAKQKELMSGERQTENFTIPTSSQAREAQLSSISSETSTLKEEPEMRMIQPQELFSTGRTSVMIELNGLSDTHDMANNDILLGDTSAEIDVSESVGMER